MRFLHTADCHLGGHRDPKLRALIEQGFTQLIDDAITRNVDFVLIAGDLFNTALPSIETLKFAVTQLGRLKEHNIPVYAIPGSHDFSPSGKTILDVLERAHLLINVFQGEIKDSKLHLRWTQDPKMGVKLAGILGMRGMLDRHHYEQLEHTNEPGEKIFLFHTAIREITPIPGSQPMSLLPQGCMYYAGGHVHTRAEMKTTSHPRIVYPGPLVPNSFSEFEELEHGGYVIYDNGSIERVSINHRPIIHIAINASNKSSARVSEELLEAAGRANARDAIVTIRLAGTLAQGTPSGVDVRAAVRVLETSGAYAVLRSSAQLTTQAIGTTQEPQGQHDVEAHVLEEHREQLAREGIDGIALAKTLLRILEAEPGDGEKQYEYEERIVREAKAALSAAPSSSED